MKATIMLADRRETVRDLNRLARERLHETGQLGQRELHAAGRAFAEGERVLALRNHRGLGLRNGDRATVVDVSDDRTLTVRLDRDDRRDLRISADYLEAGHLDHGYAATVHKAQGATLETVHYLGDETTFGEAALVAGSRHRHDFRLYVVDADLPSLTTPAAAPTLGGARNSSAASVTIAPSSSP
jgi:ATP-dependent exoDNAse (exonuclease V) alpha subunit